MNQTPAILPPPVFAAKDLIAHLIRELVDDPEAVRVDAIVGGQSVIFEVSVDRVDVRRVIGRKGRTADAVREIMTNLGAKAGMRFHLEIVEPERRLDEVPGVPASVSTVYRRNGGDLRVDHQE